MNIGERRTGDKTGGVYRGLLIWAIFYFFTRVVGTRIFISLLCFKQFTCVLNLLFMIYFIIKNKETSSEVEAAYPE